MNTLDFEQTDTPPRAAPNPQSVTLDRVAEEVLPSDVLERLRPELEAVPRAEVRQISIDVDKAVATVLGALPRLRKLRPQIVALLPTLDLTLFDKMEDYAAALNAAHGAYQATTRSTTELRELAQEATQLLHILLAEATTLVKRGVLSPNVIRRLERPVGYKNVAQSLNRLAGGLQRQWPEIASKSSLTEAELQRAQSLQWRLLRLVGESENRKPRTDAANDLRRRAFSCFVRAWNDIRRAVSHLRWEAGDANDVAPSLFRGRGGSKRKPTEVPAAEGN